MRIGALLFVAVMATTGVFMGSGTTARFVASADVRSEARVAVFDVRVGMRNADNDNFTMSENFARAGAVHANLSAAGQVFTARTTLSGPLWNTSTWPENPAVLTAPGFGNYSHLEMGRPGSPTLPRYVRPADGTVIAPGTGGRIDLRFANYSEVAVDFFLDSTSVAAALAPNINVPHSPGTTNIDAGALQTGAIQFSRTGQNGGDPNATNWGLLGGATGILATQAPVTTTAVTNFLVTEGGVTRLRLPPNTTASADTTIPLFWRWNFHINDAQDARDTSLGVASAVAMAANQPNNRPGLQLTLQIRAEQVD